MIHKNKNVVEFWSAVEGLSEIEYLRPQRMNKFIPDWWKNIPNHDEKSIKRCASFPDYFSSAWVIPMWCDLSIKIDENGVGWKSASNKFEFTFHDNSQFLDYSPAWIGREVSAILKAINPWRIKTPTGYSSYQMPMTYEFNENFSILPGIIHTDHYHQINLQMMIHSKEKEFTIVRGTPMAAYFVYQREQFDEVIREQTQDDLIDDYKTYHIYSTKFGGGYTKALKNIIRSKKND